MLIATMYVYGVIFKPPITYRYHAELNEITGLHFGQAFITLFLVVVHGTGG